MKDSRGTAETRRTQAVDAGLRAFGEHGLTTTAVTRAAQDVGVSQSYIFRLFGSKRDFFLACMNELEVREVAAFTHQRQSSRQTFEHLGAEFRTLVGDGTLAGFSIQALAVARTDPEVAQRYMRILATTLRAVHDQTGATGDELAQFLARGMLIVHLQALGVDVTTKSSTQVIEDLLEGDTP